MKYDEIGGIPAACQEVWTQLRRSCKHFHGIQRQACDRGVDYMSVRDTSGPGMAKWPCTSANGTRIKCALAEFPTEAEAKLKEAELAEAVNDFFVKMQGWICFHCNKPIARERQVGRCVYAEPCGCRLRQGKARGENPDSEVNRTDLRR